MRIKVVLVSLAMILLMASQVFSQLLVRESFEYSNGTSIDTLIGSAGNGWGGPWDLFDGNQKVMTVVDTGFAYSDLNYSVPNTGKYLRGANPTAWGWQRYGRYLAQKWTNQAGKTYWISFLINLKDYTDNGWAGLGLWDSTKEGQLFGHEWGNPLYSAGFYNTPSHSTASCHDGPQWIVVKIVMSGDTVNNQKFYMWLTPNPATKEPDTTSADGRGWSKSLMLGFNRVVVHFGGEGVGMSMSIDEIRLGTSWADVSSALTGVQKTESKIPEQFALSQNYPNPFNPTTKISFAITKTGIVKLNVYNLLGQLVQTLVNEELKTGTYEAIFNASGLPSGVYLYKLETGNTTLTKKMLLLK